MTKQLVRPLAAMAVLALGPLAGSAGAAITGTQDANALSLAMEGPGSGAELVAPPPDEVFANGVGDSPLAAFPTAGNTFTILTTGDVALADTPNTEESSGYAHDFRPAFGGEANDVSRLAIPVQVAQGQNCIGFDFKFFSEEFPEFVGSPFNDGFIAEVDQSTWSVSGETITAPNDFAAPLGQERIAVNNVGPTEVSPEQAQGTTYDGATPQVRTKAQVGPGFHVLYLSIFDASDSIYDTAVFLDNLQVTTEDPKSCRPPDTFGGQTGVTLPGGKNAVEADERSASVGVQCNAPVPCPGSIVVKVTGGTLERTALVAEPRAKKPRGKLGTASYALASGEQADVPLKLTKKGKKLLRKAKKLKAQVRVTNPTNQATATQKVTIKP